MSGLDFFPFLFWQYTLMRDPVILPSSRITVDRPIIQRHLLSDNVSWSNTMMICHISLSLKILA